MNTDSSISIARATRFKPRSNLFESVVSITVALFVIGAIVYLATAAAAA